MKMKNTMGKIKQFRIVVDAVGSKGIIRKVFEPKDGETPEDAVLLFDQWVEENMEFEEDSP